MEKILRQSFWLLGAQIISRIIGFFYVVYLARVLGVFDFGLYTVALAYFSIISSFSDFGFSRYLIREVARDASKSWELLWNIALSRLTLTSVLFAVFSVIIYWLDPNKMRVSLILLATLAVLPQSIAFSFDAIFVGIQKLRFSAISLLISSLVTSLIGLFLVSRGFGPQGAVYALISGQVIYAVFLTIFLYKHKGLVLSAINLTIIKRVIVGSLPYGILGIIGLLYFRIDAVLLSYLRGNFETGIYGAAYKFLEVSIFIPSSFALAFFPALVKLQDKSPVEMKKLYFRSLKLMSVLGIITLAAYIVILPQIIKILLPNYLKAIDAIRILSLSIPFLFVYVPLSQIILASDEHLKQITVLTVGTLLFNIVLNLFLIPKYGFQGAAFATVISDVLSFIIVLMFIRVKIFKNS